MVSSAITNLICQSEHANMGSLHCCVMNVEEPKPVTVTLDINLFYDKALGRQGEAEFDQIVGLAQQGKLKLDDSGAELGERAGV